MKTLRCIVKDMALHTLVWSRWYEYEEALSLRSCGMRYIFPFFNFISFWKHPCKEDQTLPRVTELIPWTASATRVTSLIIFVAFPSFQRVWIDKNNIWLVTLRYRLCKMKHNFNYDSFITIGWNLIVVSNDSWRSIVVLNYYFLK